MQAEFPNLSTAELETLAALAPDRGASRRCKSDGYTHELADPSAFPVRVGLIRRPLL